MSDPLSNIITDIQLSLIVQKEKDYYSNLEKINKFGGSTFEKAFLLGIFFKHQIDSDNLPPELKASLINTIKKNNLEDYYYLKTKPHSNNTGITFAIVCIAIGMAAFLCGLIWVLNNVFSVGVGTKYLDFRVRDGWTYILFSLPFLIGGVIYFRNETKKKVFIKNYLNKYYKPELAQSVKSVSTS